MLDESKRCGGADTRSLDSLLPRLSTGWSASSAAHYLSKPVIEQVHDRFQSLNTMQKKKFLLSLLHMRGPQLAESRSVIQKILEQAEATVEDDWVIRLARLFRGYADLVHRDFINAHGVISEAQVDGEFLYRLHEVMDGEQQDSASLSGHLMNVRDWSKAVTDAPGPHDFVCFIPSSMGEQQTSEQTSDFVLASPKGEPIEGIRKEASELLAKKGIGIGGDLKARHVQSRTSEKATARQASMFLSGTSVLESTQKAEVTREVKASREVSGVERSKGSREVMRVVPVGTNAAIAAHDVAHQLCGSESPLIMPAADSPLFDTVDGAGTVDNNACGVAEAVGSVDPDCPQATAPQVLGPGVKGTLSPKDDKGAADAASEQIPSPGIVAPAVTSATTSGEVSQGKAAPTRGPPASRTLPPKMSAAERAMRLSATRQRIAQKRDAAQRPKMVCMELNEAPNKEPEARATKKSRKM